MKLHKYESNEAYIDAQVRRHNKRQNRMARMTADYFRFRIGMIAEYLRQEVSPLAFGICHGSGAGQEQSVFRDMTGANVIGTDIAPTAAEKFPHTICWDFHEVKPEWIGAVDFIFSNAFDHSYKPHECIRTWMRCVRPGGVCVLYWTEKYIGSTRSDPFGATEEEYRQLLGADYEIADVLDLSRTKKTGVRKRVVAFIVKHR